MKLLKKLKIIFKGKANRAVNDMLMSDTENIEGVYNERISELKDKNSSVRVTYFNAVGKVKNLKEQIEELNEEIKKVENICDTLVKAGRIEDAKLKNKQRNRLLTEIKNKEKQIEVYNKIASEAEGITNQYSKDIEGLELERDSTVSNIKIKQNLKEMYDSLENVKDDSTSGILNEIRDAAQELDDYVCGAKEVRDNSEASKISKLDEEFDNYGTDDYIQGLIDKYKNN